MESTKIANSMLAEFDDKMLDWLTRLEDTARELEAELLTPTQVQELVRELVPRLEEALHNLPRVKGLIFELGKQLATIGLPTGQTAVVESRTNLTTLYNRIRDFDLSSFALDHASRMLMPGEDVTAVDAEGLTTSTGRRMTWTEIKAARPLSWTNLGSWERQFQAVPRRRYQ